MFRLAFYGFISMISVSALATSAIPVGKFFLVEQSSVELNSGWSQVTETTSPAGFVFWNSSKADYAKLKSTIGYYSKIAKRRGEDPWLFSIDYEGGGLNQSLSGKKIPGVQRFVKGFTPLAHPSWLGVSLKKYGTELCELHGEIMGKELQAAGVNYPLTVVSDLAYRLFSVRGISTNPENVAKCMKAFLEGIGKADSVIAVTKHFPGLGQTVGDTHDGVSVSQAKTLAEFQRHLQPFIDVIEFANQNGLDNRLSVLSSHGLFPLADSKHLTTESSELLTNLLVKQMNFRGIRVSDAMWMGDYGKLSGADLMAVYVSAFIAGTDLLMIPGAKYSAALKAFGQVAQNRIEPSLQAALEARLKLPIALIHDRFLERAKESLDRLHHTQGSLRHSIDIMTNSGVAPADITRSERFRYNQILSNLGHGGMARSPEPELQSQTLIEPLF